MQDQGRRLILAVALALGVLLLWQRFFGPKDEPKPDAGAGSGSALVAPVLNQPRSHFDLAEQAQVQPPEVIALKFPQFTAKFTSRGGDLLSWKLSDARYDHDKTQGELVNGRPTLELLLAKGSTFQIPRDAVWTGQKLDDRHVQYKLATDGLELTKTFEILPEAFLVRMTFAVAAKHDARETIGVIVNQYQNPLDDGGGSSRVQARVWNSSTLRDGTIVQSELKDVLEHPRFEQNITWTGFEHPFLLAGFAPKKTGPADQVEKHTYATAEGFMQTDLIYPAIDLKPGAPAFTREVVGYLGPKNYDQLNDADSAAGFPTGFHQVIDLGWFGFLGKRLLWLLLKFQGVVGNWGIAIILLTVVVKLVTLYWMTKSMRSMKAMAVLGPQIKELNEKYKNDKQRLQVETMALYKANGANPLSGCLPMFLQMPIWIALYRMLSNVGELYRQPFIHGWIDDLTAADPMYILPVVLVVTMFAQARLTPQNPDPAQRTQQRIMQYGMPLLFGGMAFVFPAGLTLYIFTNTCLSALHSIYMNKFDKKSLELAAKIKAAQDAKLAVDVKGAKNANAPAKTDDAVAEPAANAAPKVAPRQGPKKKKGRR